MKQVIIIPQSLYRITYKCTSDNAIHSKQPFTAKELNDELIKAYKRTDIDHSTIKTEPIKP